MKRGARKQENFITRKISGILIRLCIAGGIGLGLWQLWGILVHSEFFQIATVYIDPDLDLRFTRELKDLKGQSILTVDLQAIAKAVRQKNPHISQLRIVKRFPNQIHVLARRRKPFAHVQIQGRPITLDPLGIVLTTEGPFHDLPRIEGTQTMGSNIQPGKPLKAQRLDVALRILRSFQKMPELSVYHVKSINVANLSEIQLILSNHLKVFLDLDSIPQKLVQLSILLDQEKMKINQYRYVDLRFQEPVLGTIDGI